VRLYLDIDGTLSIPSLDTPDSEVNEVGSRTLVINRPVVDRLIAVSHDLRVATWWATDWQHRALHFGDAVGYIQSAGYLEYAVGAEDYG
jgi:hypothetical protein